MSELFRGEFRQLDGVKVIRNEKAERINSSLFPTLIDLQTIAIHPDDEEEFISLFERKEDK